jgi:hypothetical protein
MINYDEACVHTHPELVERFKAINEAEEANRFSIRDLIRKVLCQLFRRHLGDKHESG